MIDDQKLSEHFGLYELTQTSHTDLQEKNRMLQEEQIVKLRNVAMLLENIRLLLEVPLVVHSGYRCHELNQRVGSTDKSQHLLCEAADFVPKGMDLAVAFNILRKAAKDKKISWGQIIHETAERSYGTTSWIHISLGAPYRDAGRCGEALTMIDGKTHLIEQIKESMV